MPYEKIGKNEPVCIADEVPFDIPESWEWVRLGTISTYAETKKKINAKLLEEKKKTYAEYRHSREEMRELLTAKANVDRLLKMDEEQKKEQEKDHGQR